ncbi:carbohydrate-binding module family 20 domain-containing protein [Nocardiopsis halophila]|uniref:carbohydrate-binding module family 20 domain-containing protein n=1 Tax=Nocardiopsis halophila TaxID=141692 RepID=UPI00034A6063|nr:carbohydrate-binding module family 20 domain-containing protein [Nocardiopsis halophila]
MPLILRRTLTLAAVLLLGAALPAAAPWQPASGAPAAAAASPAAAPDDGGAVVHLFQWRWESVAQECEDVLGPNGYAAVQVSPPQEHVVLEEEGYPWWQDYQPVSYRLDDTRRGTAADFQDMVDRCRDSGVRIYVDAIVNHMTGTGSVGSGPGSAGGAYEKYSYPDLFGDGAHGYTEQDFNTAECGRDIEDWSDPWEVRTCELLGLSDLATGDAYVRERLGDYLASLVDMGVAGFRIDAAKHMPPEDLQAVVDMLPGTVPGWNEAPYVFQEVIADAAIGEDEYTGIGDVTEFEYQRRIGHDFADGNLQGAKDLEEGNLASDSAVSFVVNHDTQRSEPTLTHGTDRDRYDLAQAFLLAHGYGTPKVMSSYAFTSTEQGPPMAADGTTEAADCSEERWVCEHRALNGMPTFASATAGEEVSWVDDGSQQGRVALERGGAGFAAFNATGSEWSVGFATALPDGTYCDVASGTFADGACDGAAVEVAGGRVEVSVPPEGAVALHTGAVVECADPGGCDSGGDPGDPGACTEVEAVFGPTVETFYGQGVYVAGSVEELGGWDTGRALELSTDEGAYPEWSGSVGLPPGAEFEYKYIKKDPDGTVAWESGGNRTAVASGDGCAVEFGGEWRD